ncbi:pantoate--beta-alanine ligase [Cellulomonas xylanilytica]|uniref:Pantothenate synthetase n=1 Tax=Cellulomonas xylanilytica TaxID=233583 RepID=A0A510V6N5_9CELL|nr:pantoate--beta-alanine ligase [Cellulomonas xylanilytica]GEK22533.1 pantothenate synthetase [Cellulomonas xylanilytica]
MTTQTTTPTLVHTREALAAALAVQDVQAVPRTEGYAGTAHSARPHRRAVVMTMGALHAGHLSLVARARELADAVVVTIFVNPLQFAPSEDLARYPRDLQRDLALLSGPGLLGPDDIVFAPGPEVVYPDGDPVVRVSAGHIGDVLEGVSRPGHLDGVLTVVLKLLHLTRPGVALFGAKDAQQLAAVRRMVRDLDVPVVIEAAPIVRDEDGIALSSRNAYLSDEERGRALGLSRALRASGSADQIRGTARAALAETDVDYVALVDPETFAEVPADFVGEALLLVAATVGTTRLIDNGPVEVRP